MEHTKNSCGRYRFFEATRISRRQMIACCALVFSIFTIQSSISAQDTVRTLDEVMIQDTRVSNKAPLTTSTVNRAELGDARGSVALPFMLETQPSVVASGENGSVGASNSGEIISVTGSEYKKPQSFAASKFFNSTPFSLEKVALQSDGENAKKFILYSSDGQIYC